MKTLYCDASFDWTHTEKNGEDIVRGKVAVVGDGIARMDRVAVGKVEGLKQYINVFELTAIARAVELASEMNKAKPLCDHPEQCNHWSCHPTDSLAIYTDSRTAMIWASSGKIKGGVRTLAHENALEYLRKVRLQFGGLITFNFVRREGNPAGELLEKELEKEKPHAI